MTRGIPSQAHLECVTFQGTVGQVTSESKCRRALLPSGAAKTPGITRHACRLRCARREPPGHRRGAVRPKEGRQGRAEALEGDTALSQGPDSAHRHEACLEVLALVWVVATRAVRTPLLSL
ncbi:unnamed protein product [Rangifer tarandus platyrhynchus]|uniref:Uncharacterized protein n=2 Tax=Rangifer tarandus platyrhynchus TaxID=3082113 RepID=A0ABN8YAR0_RANTA|nr:unnamed protein product [Rangifer tarandus platyrhynchus]CAI9696030.1 unnamed protein product [Rangifer tarandus platyrhynchus]